MLSSGVGVGTGGASVGDAQANQQEIDQFNQDVADELADQLGESFRSEFIPTLMGNQPGQAPLGDPDPDPTGPADDDETARAPSAFAFGGIATEATQNIIANQNILQTASMLVIDDRLEALNTTADAIRDATQRTADLPLVQQLVDAGIAFPRSNDENALNVRSSLSDLLSAGGINLFAGFDAIDRRLNELITPANVEFPLADERDRVASQSEEIEIRLMDTLKVQIMNKEVPVHVMGGKLDVSGNKIDASGSLTLMRQI